MQGNEIKRTLEKCGIPVAYHKYEENKAPALPYVNWYVGGETNFAADDENYHNVKLLTVELYTRIKEFDTEAAVERVLDTLGVWSKTEVYIETERCYQIVYDLEV